MTHEQLKKVINETIDWANDLSERWTGTLHEKIITVQKDRLITANEKNNMELACDFMYDLAQTLVASEKEYEIIEG